MALVMYERLERYNEQTGVLKGAHVKLFDTVTGKEGEAMSYTSAAALGFAQSDILTQVETGAIAALDAKIAEHSVIIAIKDEQLAIKDAQIAALKSQIAG